MSESTRDEARYPIVPGAAQITPSTIATANSRTNEQIIATIRRIGPEKIREDIEKNTHTIESLERLIDEMTHLITNSDRTTWKSGLQRDTFVKNIHDNEKKINNLKARNKFFEESLRLAEERGGKRKNKSKSKRVSFSKKGKKRSKKYSRKSTFKKKVSRKSNLKKS